MPQLIRPGAVKLMTQDGEIQVSITLELNINLNTDGVQVAAQAVQQAAKQQTKQETTEWAIPDFAASPQLDFGKRE